MDEKRLRKLAGLLEARSFKGSRNLDQMLQNLERLLKVTRWKGVLSNQLKAELPGTEKTLDQFHEALKKAARFAEDLELDVGQSLEAEGVESEEEEEVLLERPTGKALNRLILVTDAQPDSELIDVFGIQRVSAIVKIFKAPGIERENPTLYLLKDEKDARKDAEERLARVKRG